MSSNPVRLQYLFERYLANACTLAELEEFWQLLADLSANDTLPEYLQAYWDKERRGYKPSDTVNWKKVTQRMQERIKAHKAHEVDFSRYKLRRVWRWQAIAAAVLLLAAGTWWFGPRRSKKEEPKVTAQLPAKPITAGHRVISLPDGTSVTLNTGSKLDYPAVFSGNTRDVYLNGEAYFDVKHDTSKPFLVHMGKYITRVLGTAFNIKAYPDREDVEVTVVRGKVEVSDRKRILGILLPNDQLVISKQNGKAVKEQIIAAKVIEWKKEDMIFEDVTIRDAVAQVQNCFGIKIFLENEALGNCRFTASFQSTDASLEQVLDAMTILTHSHWEKNGNTILLSGKGFDALSSDSQ